MNIDRKIELTKITHELMLLIEKIQGIKEAEQKDFDNMHPNFKASASGLATQAGIDQIENAETSMHDAIDAVAKAAQE